jgi:putative Ca2+/H+ antiporter (TMEM165/GDT1 family)
MDLRVLLTSFGLIFLAELPDKTTYTVLLLATRKSALSVLAGAWAAFVIQGLVALALGSLVARLPEHLVRWITAGILFVFGLLLLFRDAPDDEPVKRALGRRALAEAFGLVLIAEMGDATQFGTVALVARFDSSPWSVFTGATLALWSVSAIAVVVGNALGSRLPRRPLRKVAGAIFCLFAIGSAIFM